MQGSSEIVLAENLFIQIVSVIDDQIINYYRNRSQFTNFMFDTPTH